MTIDNPYTTRDSQYPSKPPRRGNSTGSAKGRTDDAGEMNSVSLVGDGQQQKIQDIQTELSAAKGVMETNILKIQERGETLDQLQHKTDSLSLQGQKFRSKATEIRRRMWLQNAKITICLSLFIALLLGGIIAGAIRGSKLAKDSQVEKEKVEEHNSTLNAMSAASTPSAGTGRS